jgi:hypothetical protein
MSSLALAKSGLSSHYSPRAPEKSILYQAILEHMNTVFQNMEEKGRYLPEYVKEEFDAFLKCGLLSQGFLRLECEGCQREKLVAFSCKKRGLCPSCGGRRMCDTAAHLVDNVFPEVGVRQWVLSFPHHLRYLFAYKKEAVTKALEVIIRAINGHYKEVAKEQGLENVKTGSVTLIQRFGGSLNLNVHFHILYVDGVYDDEGNFIALRPPSNEEVEILVEKIQKRVERALERKGWIEGRHISEEDPLALEFGGLAESYASSIQRKNNLGKKTEQLGKQFDLIWSPGKGDLCAYKDGYSLHGNVQIEAWDREGLEQICRYVARPAIALSRLSKQENGKIVYKLKKAYSDGTTHLRFSGEEFVEKLIALIPSPRMNLTRYHGALGPKSNLRSKVVKKNKKIKSKKEKMYKISWAKLLKRVFDFEVERCECGCRLKLKRAVLGQDFALGVLRGIEYQSVYSKSSTGERATSGIF